MSIETSKAIATVVATELVKKYGAEAGVDDAIVFEYIMDELPGLDPDKTDEVEKLVYAYIEVAQVHVSIPTIRVNNDGTLRSDEELSKALDVNVW